MKLCSIITRVEGTIALVWVVKAVIEEYVKPEDAIPEYINRTSEERFYRTIAFLEELSKQLLNLKEQELLAEEAMALSKESEEKYKMQMYRSEAMTSVVRLLGSEDAFSKLADEIIQEDSGKYGKTFDELRQHLNFDCGLKGYTGTNSGIEISERVKNGDKQAELAYRGFAYQVGKEIGAASAVLKGKVDTIILTGGFAFDKELMSWISEYVSFIAPVTVYPGEDEMQALAQGGIRVLKGEEEAKVY